MSPPEPATQHASSREEAGSQTSSHSTNRWSKYVADVGHVFNATLRSSYANYLLPFVALGIVAGALSWNSAAVFVLNFLAIFPLASLLSYSTEELSASVGQTFGGLINATFGNAVELIVSYLTTVHLFPFHFADHLSLFR
jgi:Ca2+:H+ antiporter